MVKPFHKYEGVNAVISGYTGGESKNPTYQEVCSGQSGHIEAIEVQFDSNKISYQKLLDVYWQAIDPTDLGGQFHDRGSQYQPAIFYHSEAQREAAEQSKKDLEASGVFQNQIVVPVLPAKEFFAAEDDHQDYYLKNPEHYENYYDGSGRKAFIEDAWKGKA